ncbi:MAG: hypothetical protein AB1Z98_16100 [Nannocystaceae bacterium]
MMIVPPPKTTWLASGMLALATAALLIGCAPKPDTEAEATCQYCTNQGWASVTCTLDVNGLHSDEEEVACSRGTDAASLAQACNDACAAFTAQNNGKVCVGVVGNPETFLCHGTSYATEGLPGFGTSGSGGADETTASEPVWEPHKYASYDQVSDEYIVDADFVDALKLDPALLVLDGVSLDYLTTGGWEFGGVTSGSLMDRLGLQNGDIPQTVNGYDVTTLDGVLAARSALDSATSLTVVVTRSGSTVTLEYSIQ